jgi:hypothetical protein
MAHKVTAPAMQRAQRLLEQRVTPFITQRPLNFTVTATDEWFESPSYDTATSAPVQTFAIGSKWGRAWHTRWFHLQSVVPEELSNVPLVAYMDLGFVGRGDGFQVEAVAWRNGEIVHAIQPDRRLIHLGTQTAGSEVDIWVEAAATPIIAGHEYGYGPTTFGDPSTAPTTPIYTLRAAYIATFNSEVNDLAIALHAVIDLALDLPDNSPQRSRIFSALEKCDLALDVAHVIETASTARQALDALQQVMRTLILRGCGQFVRLAVKLCALLQMLYISSNRIQMRCIAIVKHSIIHGLLTMHQIFSPRLRNLFAKDDGNQWVECGLRPISTCPTVKACCDKSFKANVRSVTGSELRAMVHFFPTTLVIPAACHR